MYRRVIKGNQFARYDSFKPIVTTDLVSAIEALSNQSEEFTDLDSSGRIPGTCRCGSN